MGEFRPGGASVFHQTDIARIGQTLIDVAPSAEFAAGVAALCSAVGAPVRLPERPTAVTVEQPTGRQRLALAGREVGQ